MKNKKMSVTITMAILLVNAVCILLLYVVANSSMTKMMKQSEMENLHATLKEKTGIIEEYIYHQEDLLIAFSDETVVIEYLKDPTNEEKRKMAQWATEKYYARFDNWEGLYIGEWDSHVITHSNPDVVGMYTRQGESLKQLQNEMLSRNGLYDAGIIVSPASQKLVVSLYCPVFDYDEKTIIGYVGGGPFAEELDTLLFSEEDRTTEYFMINAETKMYIFARDNELIATQVKDEMLLSILPIVLEDESKWSGDTDYYDKKEGKSIAAYQYIPKHGWVVVSCNSESNIYADVNKSMNVLGIICVGSVVLLAILSWFFIRLSTKPLKYVERAIIQLKDMNLEKDPKLDPYIGCESEVGQIATAINSLYDSIGSMLQAETEKQVAIAESESKARFLASMSHEIRTPINTVIGMNEMILRENRDSAIKDYANNIKSASQMLLSLVNDVLDLSKMEAGQLQLVEGDYRVADMLKDAALAIVARVKHKDLQLKLDFAEDLPSVLRGDEIRIKQVLNNLLSNAAKYTKKGSITFTAKGEYGTDGFNLVLSVADTGIGIRKEDMEKLFQRFLRLEMDKNRYIEGTGLGLNISRQLVDNMNGTIDVVSEYGQGSCFTVRIPQTIVDEAPIGDIMDSRKKDSEEQIQESEKTFFVAPDKKVLIVDDHKMNLTVLKTLLKRSLVQVDCAGGGKECLQLTKEKKYDIILMDHMMPEPDGIQTLHLIREDEENLNRETTVVVITANAIPGMEDNYLKEGFAGYLSKPIMADKLDEMLAVFLKQDN